MIRSAAALLIASLIVNRWSSSEPKSGIEAF